MAFCLHPMEATMENYRLRIKIGDCEFEAEGSQEIVERQFSEFKELLKSPPVSNHQESNNNGGGANEGNAPKLITPVFFATNQYWKTFKFDEKRNLLSLSIKPMGDAAQADAILLLLFGYKFLKEQDEVIVTQLKDGLEQSGFSVNRIDRVIAPYVRSLFVIKTGKAKGGRYRLTNSGTTKAQTLANQLIELVS